MEVQELLVHTAWSLSLPGVWPALRLSSPRFLPTAEEKKEEKKEESEESDDDMGFGLFD